MELSEILIIIVLFLNLIAILFVAYQTYLSRNSLLLTIKNLNQDRKKHDVELLPKAHFIFKAQFHLNRWLKSVTDINTELKKAIKIQDADTLKKLAGKALKSPKGLVDGFSFEKGPNWLVELLLAGAQYYFLYHAALNDLWDEVQQTPSWEKAPEIIKTGEEYSFHLKSLLNYIDQAIPESYAEAPAGIYDDSVSPD
jgi:hypothetical protein